MITFDHDKFLPPFVKLSTSPCCTYFSSQYDGTHYNDNAQHGTRYNSTKRTTLPLPGKSLSTINVHNDRPIDSAHFAQPMSHDSTYTSPFLAHVCSDRPADSTCIVSYIGRQYVRTVLNVDIVGSSKCHTRHLATGGVARFNYILVTNSNPVTTCASDGRVNPYPNKMRVHYKYLYQYWYALLQCVVCWSLVMASFDFGLRNAFEFSSMLADERNAVCLKEHEQRGDNRN